MPQQNFGVNIGYQATETRRVAKTVYEDEQVSINKSLALTLSDSMIGALEDAKTIATQLGQAAVTTEMIILAVLTRKTPKNVTTTGGKFLKELGVDAGSLAAKVAAKYNRSRYDLSASFGGWR